MVYLVPIPGLVILALLAVEDIRTRRVARAWVLLGVILQLASIVVYCALTHQELWPLIIAISLGLVSSLLQTALALVRPGAIGFGDVTATALAAFSLGILGWPTAVLFWLLLGLLGLLAILLYYHWPLSRKQHSSPEHEPFPFVAVIFVAAALATLLSSLCAE